MYSSWEAQSVGFGGDKVKWGPAKKSRERDVGKRCEHCGTKPTKHDPLIGHHVIPKSIIRRDWEPLLQKIYGIDWKSRCDELFNIRQLIRIRCVRCERYLHRFCKWGNLQADNAFAEEYLAKLTVMLGELQRGRH